jgi:hypothetical protein
MNTRKLDAAQVQIIDGGKGKSGCNTGPADASTWVRSYTAASGVVPGLDDAGMFDIEGLAMPYGAPCDPELHDGEQIVFTPGSFSQAIGKGARLLLDHREDFAVASEADGTLTFRETDEALWFAARVPATALGGLVLAGVRNGTITGCCVKPTAPGLQRRDGDRTLVADVPAFDLSLMVRGRPSFPQTFVRLNPARAKSTLWAAMQHAHAAAQE